MARIDSILGIVTQQNANELRVGTDREPKMFAFGTPKRLAMPATDEDTLRNLLGELLTPEREEQMKTKGKIELAYDAATFGQFHVSLARREGQPGFDAIFTKRGGGAPKREAAPPPVPTPVRAPALAVVPSPISSPTPVLDSAPVSETIPQIETTMPAIALDSSSPFVNLVAQADAMRASDLHLQDGEAPRVRVDGQLRRLEYHGDVDVAALLALDDAGKNALARGHAIDAGLDVPEVGRLRLHAFRTSTGLCAAVRILPKSAPSIASLHLGVPIDSLVDLPHGLVLVVGATGSGKSTTLAALAQEALKRRSIALSTLEDPIEVPLVCSSQSILRRREVGRDVPDFHSGLRDALREDPDVLLVGEMRDRETISLALTAAETGHLVLASLHASSTTSAVERIVDSYPPERAQQIRVQLADSLKVVLAQRLLPRTRGGGRIAACEYLKVNHAVAAIIREGKTAQLVSAMQSGKAEGMTTLEKSLADRVANREITLETARGAANDLGALQNYLPRG
ncbi:MAG TPA: PilT/PilU family type 4a pilus ATPase [Polyangiaceae bacterium]